MLKYLFAIALASQAWSLHTGTPVTLSDPRMDCLWPEITIDEQGRSAVAWIYNQGDRQKALCAASRDREGGTWSEAQMLSDWEYYVGFHCCHFDPSGNLSVFWRVETETTFDTDEYVQWITKTFGKNWGPSERCQQEKNFSWRQSIAFEPNNQMMSTSVENLDLPNSYERKYFVKAGPFPPYKKKSANVFVSSNFLTKSYIIIDREGNSLIYWTYSDYKPGVREEVIGGSRKIAGNEWSKAEIIGRLSGFSVDIDASMVGENIALVCKCDDQLSAVVHSENGWSETETLGDLHERWDDAKVCVDEKGNVLAVWASREEQKNRIYAKYKSKGQPWSDLVEIYAGTHDIEDIRIAYDDVGHFIVVWEQMNRNFPSIWSTQFSLENFEFSKPMILSPVGQNCRNFSMAFANGKGVISWITTDNGFDWSLQVADLVIDK